MLTARHYSFAVLLAEWDPLHAIRLSKLHDGQIIRIKMHDKKGRHTKTRLKPNQTKRTNSDVLCVSYMYNNDARKRYEGPSNLQKPFETASFYAFALLCALLATI